MASSSEVSKLGPTEPFLELRDWVQAWLRTIMWSFLLSPGGPTVQMSKGWACQLGTPGWYTPASLLAHWELNMTVMGMESIQPGSREEWF